MRILSIVLIFIGESIAIYAEVFSSKLMINSQNILWGIFTKSLSLMIIGCILLLFGYILGTRSFHSIWIVSVISITSILIAEPILNYIIFQELPARGALIGLIFGILGFIATFIL